MKLNLVRHLPTTWNLAGKLQGRQNIQIDERQIEVLRENISNNKKRLKCLEPFDLVLASSLVRTKQTADVYAYKPIIEPLLDELDFGSYEGQSKICLLQNYQENWYDNPEKIILGEPMLSLETRVLLFLNKYKHYENLLVFGHGSWIRALISIHKVGSINVMNKLTLENNELVQVEMSYYHFCRS